MKSASPAYIPVTIKSSSAKKIKLDNNQPEQKHNPAAAWPESLKQYVATSFSECLPGKQSQLEEELRVMIVEASKSNALETTDWDELDLPRVHSENRSSACGGIRNPNAPVLLHKSLKISKVAKTAGIGSIANTPEELRRRQLRAKRFESDKPVKRLVLSAADDDENGVLDYEGKPVVGTCTDLEKPYFRLTSAVDPTTVRPLPVLKKTFKMLKKKWKKTRDYSYVCEQFKSMRQDLTVQCIRDEFASTVYEYHARVALEKGDLGEYNQCQTQLKYLYANIKSSQTDEFTAYRILYFLYTRNQSDINSLLNEVCVKGKGASSGKHKPCVRHALEVRSSLATRNYHKFFKLYQNAPNMGGYLMDQFVGRERVEALIVLCKA
ncbi:hypothetical protein EC973_009547 [Apophysomyces ossiformis]|uniref:PCI domain-containing protein n=1 Tax=Apophysomyces ossiformis TaxID=679940 RepID=A0A8H7BVH5_9FUNG|nr:hypothetical protein EC973_009547 [Apophysomyces ossiformis]